MLPFVIFCILCSIKEDRFWRNYFYRVSLIKQSAQLKSLATADEKVCDVPEEESETDVICPEDVHLGGRLLFVCFIYLYKTMGRFALSKV